MKIKQLNLHNYRRFESLQVDFAPAHKVKSNITVLIGNNGSGKSSVLEALATGMNWFVALMKNGEEGNNHGQPMREDVILNGQSSAAIDIRALNGVAGKSYQWRMAKAAEGKKPEYTPDLKDLIDLADHYRTGLTEDNAFSLPLLVYYPVERLVSDGSFARLSDQDLTQLEGYHNHTEQSLSFKRFFQWCRERENIENASLRQVTQDMLKALDEGKQLNEMDVDAYKAANESSRDKQLNAVRHAISCFMPGFENLRVGRLASPFGLDPHFLINKDGETLNVSQLSQGEKSLMALVGDIARRLAMMNPALTDPLQGEGVVLIDEVDMHLHPSWQRSIIERLAATFPNCQFVLTTHSALVISDYRDVLVYTLNDGELTIVPSQYGQDANTVLLDVMDTHIRNAEIAAKLNDLLDLIQDGKLEQARTALADLETEQSPGAIEIVKARLLLKKQELRLAKNK